MRVCPKCGWEWIAEKSSSELVTYREVRLLDINHDEVDHDLADKYTLRGFTDYICLGCNHLFSAQTMPELWDELEYRRKNG